MAQTHRGAAICDANILIDYIDADEDILRELVKYWGTVYVPDRVLAEVHGFTEAHAVDLGLTIIESPLLLEKHPALSIQDSICLYFVTKEKYSLSLSFFFTLGNNKTLMWSNYRADCFIQYVFKLIIVKHHSILAAILIPGFGFMHFHSVKFQQLGTQHFFVRQLGLILGYQGRRQSAV